MGTGKLQRVLEQGIPVQKNPKLAELFAFIGWSIWHERNARKVAHLLCQWRKFTEMLWNV